MDTTGYLDVSNSQPVCQFHAPDSSSSAKCDADLMWLAGYAAESHDIYFGTDRDAVASANSTSHKDNVKYFGQLKDPSNVVATGVSKEITDFIHTTGGLMQRKQQMIYRIIVGPVRQFKCVNVAKPD